MAEELKERMATMEATAEACQNKQDERHEKLESRMGRFDSRIGKIEDRHIMLLTTALFTLARVVSTLIILLLKK